MAMKMFRYTCIICERNWRTLYEHFDNYVCPYQRCRGPGKRVISKDNLSSL